RRQTTAKTPMRALK
ncbi:flagellar M-ring family protein, partial [Vibrio parahaemolyticus V-223/04]